MKTAEEWKSYIASTNGQDIITVNQFIEAIQQDAYSQARIDGMKEAAQTCEQVSNIYERGGMIQSATDLTLGMPTCRAGQRVRKGEIYFRKKAR